VKIAVCLVLFLPLVDGSTKGEVCSKKIRIKKPNLKNKGDEKISHHRKNG